MPATVERGSCHNRIESDSAFCRHCGRPVPKVVPNDRQATLARTGRFSTADEVDEALKAVNEYQNRWPDGPEKRDVI